MVPVARVDQMRVALDQLGEPDLALTRVGVYDFAVLGGDLFGFSDPGDGIRVRIDDKRGVFNDAQVLFGDMPSLFRGDAAHGNALGDIVVKKKVVVGHGFIIPPLIMGI